MGFTRRLSAVTVLVTATTALGLASAAQGIPDTVGQQRLTFYFPDSDRPLASPCGVGITMSSGPRISGTNVIQWGYLDVDPLSESCRDVPWQARVTIVDTSPLRPVRAVSDEDGPNAAPQALAQQTVAYGMGVREVGVLTFQFEAFSRLGRICVIDVWHMNAITWTLAPAGPPLPCPS